MLFEFRDDVCEKRLSLDIGRLFSILWRHVSTLDVLHDLFPQFVVLVVHRQSKLIQLNVTLFFVFAMTVQAVRLQEPLILIDVILIAISNRRMCCHGDSKQGTSLNQEANHRPFIFVFRMHISEQDSTRGLSYPETRPDTLRRLLWQDAILPSGESRSNLMIRAWLKLFGSR